MLIPILIEPIQDELFYSYLARLAKENEFMSLSQFINAYFFFNRDNKDRNKTLLSYDANTAFSAFSHYGYMTEDPVRFYLDHTIYGATAPFLTPQRQTKMINNAFRPDNALEDINNTVNSTISELRFCPVCAKEDFEKYGTRIYYRSHNLPGVTVCRKHHVPLMVVKDTQTHVMEKGVSAEPCMVRDEKVETDFAEYSAQFLSAEPDINISDFAAAVSIRLHELDLLSKTEKYEKLENYIQDNKLTSYFSGSVSHFMKVSLVSPKYVNRASAMALSMLLFPDPGKITGYIDRDTDEKEKFISALGGQYLICRPYRSSILSMVRQDTGEYFVTTVDGFPSTWREYSADYNKNSQQKFEEVFHAVQDGSYTLVEPFLGMNTPVTIKHTTCGKTLKIRPRNFIEDGTRCKCESIISEKQASDLLRKKSEDFTLLSYQRMDKEAAILHTKCGKSFIHIFRTFLDHPNCPFCTIKYMPKSEEIFQRQLSDLTGSEYSLVGPYIDKDTKVQIRHNKCGKVFECLPRHFIDDGQRCPVCTREITDAKFSELVRSISCGRYIVKSRQSANLYEIFDNKTESTLRLTKLKTMQELLRPTPSEILPLDKKGSADMPITMKDRIMVWLKEHYDPDDVIFLEDIHIEGILYKLLKVRITDLVKDGLLVRIGFGILAFRKMDLTDEDMIRERYLIRYHHREGILFGASLAYQLGVTETEPLAIQILTNRESAETGGRTKKIGNLTIRLKGSERLITDNNYKVLEAIDLIEGRFHYGWDMDKIRTAIAELGVRSEDIRLYSSTMNPQALKTLDLVMGETHESCQ